MDQLSTVFPRSLDPFYFYIISHYTNLIKTSWTYSNPDGPATMAKQYDLYGRVAKPNSLVGITQHVISGVFRGGGQRVPSFPIFGGKCLAPPPLDFQKEEGKIKEYFKILGISLIRGGGWFCLPSPPNTKIYFSIRPAM